MNNYYGTNLRGDRNDRSAQQWQRQAQAEQFGQAQQFQMAGAAQRDAMTRRPTASDVGSPPAQQPRYQNTQPGETIGFVQPLGGVPTPPWALAYQMPPAGGFSSMLEALGQPAAEYSRHPSPYQQPSAYSEVREPQHFMRMLHGRRDRSTHTQDFWPASMMIA